MANHYDFGTLRVAEPNPSVVTGKTLRLSPAEVNFWLEWAGSKLLALNITSPAPKEPHVAWPAYAQTAIAAYGYTQERLRPPAPTKYEIDLMDEILRLPSLCDNVTRRQILHCRALVTPVSNRRLFSLEKIAVLLHTNRQNILRWHNAALGEIVAKLPPQKAYVLRQSIARLTL